VSDLPISILHKFPSSCSSWERTHLTLFWYFLSYNVFVIWFSHSRFHFLVGSSFVPRLWLLIHFIRYYPSFLGIVYVSPSLRTHRPVVASTLNVPSHKADLMQFKYHSYQKARILFRKAFICFLLWVYLQVTDAQGNHVEIPHFLKQKIRSIIRKRWKHITDINHINIYVLKIKYCHMFHSSPCALNCSTPYGTNPWYNTSSLYKPRMDHTENTLPLLLCVQAT
jgi:hypothetical protein